MSRSSFGSLALALAMFATALGPLAACGGNCPHPTFPAASGGGVTARVEGAGVVVRWAPTPDDPIPDRYYGLLVPDGGPKPQLPAPVTGTMQRAPREMVLEIADAAKLVGSGREFALRLQMPDTRGFTECHHPGMTDWFYVTLTVAFPAAGGVEARFSKVDWSPGPL